MPIKLQKKSLGCAYQQIYEEDELFNYFIFELMIDWINQNTGNAGSAKYLGDNLFSFLVVVLQNIKPTSTHSSAVSIIDFGGSSAVSAMQVTPGTDNKAPHNIIQIFNNIHPEILFSNAAHSHLILYKEATEDCTVSSISTEIISHY